MFKGTSPNSHCKPACNQPFAHAPHPEKRYPETKGAFIFCLFYATPSGQTMAKPPAGRKVCLSREKPKGCHRSEANPKPFVFTRHTAEKQEQPKSKANAPADPICFSAALAPHTPPPF
jgi:hypothetical protein